MSRTALLASICLLVQFPPQQGAVAADRVVIVDAARMTLSVPFMQGLLHGFQPDDSLDATRVGVHLRPGFWRLSFGDSWTKYRYEPSLDRYNVRLEVVSWHELGSQPSSMPAHARTLRNLFRNSAYFSPAYVPELHFNENGQPHNIQIPGWLVGRLYYAEQANLDFFSRACWLMWERAVHSFSNCMESLQGVFMRDLITPPQPYYVYRTCAEVAANARIVATSTDLEVNVLASRNDVSSTVKAMVGMRHTTANISVDLVFTNFPYRADAVDVSVSRLVNNNAVNHVGEPKAQPAVPPHTSFAGRGAMTDGRLTVNIQPFADGEIYVIASVPTATVATDVTDGHRPVE